MGKAKTSEGRKKSFQKLTKHDPSLSLRHPGQVLETLFECLSMNDIEAFRDVLVAHLHTVNKTKLAAEKKIGRQTIYDLMNPEKEFNPTIETVGSILSFIRAAA